MRIGITGTPGTGKTSVAQQLGEELGLSVYTVEDLAEEHNLVVDRDAKRDAAVIDEEELGEIELPSRGVFEGHLAHFLSGLDALVVLRCHPDTLEKRLQEKGWSEEKIKENVEAEGLDIVLQEALQEYDAETIKEIETTEKDAGGVVEIIKDLLSGDADTDYGPGNVNFTEVTSTWK